MSGLTKQEKENWIIEHFLELYNREKNEDFSILRRVPEHEAAGPDYLIRNSKEHTLGVEVCELLDHPSSVTGEQRVKERLLKNILGEELCGISNLYLTYETSSLPTKNLEVESLAKDGAKKINHLIKSGKKEGSFTIRGVIFNFFISTESDSNVIGKEYGPDSNRFYISLLHRVEDKITRSVKYDKTFTLVLVIYNNAEQSIFRENNTFKRILTPVIKKWKQHFNEVWLLEGRSPIDRQVYGLELISYANN